MAFDLSGRVALVTGAGQGVGAGIAEALAGNGASVAVNDIDRQRAQAVAGKLPGRAVSMEADVTDPDAVGCMVDEVESTLGPVDILVNNAGLPAEGIQLHQFRDSTPDDWEPLLRLNLYAVLYCCAAVVDGMCERRWGRVVIISSDAARQGTAIGLSLYGAGKAAAAGFSRHLAQEVAPLGVTVNCVSLGTMFRPGMDEERLARRYPVGRLGRPADAAAAVLYLASEEAAWVTGQTLPVNGGMQS